jgi:UDP-GlcNAc:undecaprenyl-phosphate GlcNAc-1-phosphate transferase
MALTLDPAPLYWIAFFAPLAATALLTPLAARLARRLDVLDQPASNKAHREATPYLGGFAMAIGLVVVGGIAAGAEGELLTILLAGLALSIVGLLDDRLTVGPIVKLAVEVGAGVALWLAGARGGLFDVYALDLLLTVVWVVAITNFLNMLDNMDGLAAGVGAIAAGGFFVIAADRGEYLVGAFALAVAGASLGFLAHNFPPARIFMGDAGALLLGFLLAALGLKLDLVGEGGLVRSAAPVLLLGVPILDGLLVITARLRDGRRVYVGGTDHSSHRLAGLGLSGRVIALITYGVELAACGVALWLLAASWETSMVIVVGVAAIAGVGMGLLLSVRPSPREVTPEDVEYPEPSEATAAGPRVPG